MEQPPEISTNLLVSNEKSINPLVENDDKQRAPKRSSSINDIGYYNDEIITQLINTKIFKYEIPILRDREDILSHSHLEKCAICHIADCSADNKIIFCDGCPLCYHQLCFGLRYIPEGRWYCSKKCFKDELIRQTNEEIYDYDGVSTNRSQFLPWNYERGLKFWSKIDDIYFNEDLLLQLQDLMLNYTFVTKDCMNNIKIKHEICSKDEEKKKLSLASCSYFKNFKVFFRNKEKADIIYYHYFWFFLRILKDNSLKICKINDINFNETSSLENQQSIPSSIEMIADYNTNPMLLKQQFFSILSYKNFDICNAYMLFDSNNDPEFVSEFSSFLNNSTGQSNHIAKVIYIFICNYIKCENLDTTCLRIKTIQDNNKTVNIFNNNTLLLNKDDVQPCRLPPKRATIWAYVTPPEKVPSDDASRVSDNSLSPCSTNNDTNNINDNKSGTPISNKRTLASTRDDDGLVNKNTSSPKVHFNNLPSGARAILIDAKKNNSMKHLGSSGTVIGWKVGWYVFLPDNTNDPLFVRKESLQLILDPETKMPIINSNQSSYEHLVQELKLKTDFQSPLVLVTKEKKNHCSISNIQDDNTSKKKQKTIPNTNPSKTSCSNIPDNVIEEDLSPEDKLLEENLENFHLLYANSKMQHTTDYENRYSNCQEKVHDYAFILRSNEKEDTPLQYNIFNDSYLPPPKEQFIDGNLEIERIIFDKSSENNSSNIQDDYLFYSNPNSDLWDNTCAVCSANGELLCCDYCTRAFHLTCLEQETFFKFNLHCASFKCHNCHSNEMLAKFDNIDELSSLLWLSRRFLQDTVYQNNIFRLYLKDSIKKFLLTTPKSYVQTRKLYQKEIERRFWMMICYQLQNKVFKRKSHFVPEGYLKKTISSPLNLDDPDLSPPPPDLVKVLKATASEPFMNFTFPFSTPKPKLKKTNPFSPNHRETPFSICRKYLDSLITQLEQTYVSTPPDPIRVKIKLPNVSIPPDISTHDFKCICNADFSPNQFYLSCSMCKRWYHGSCVHISPKQTMRMGMFYCPQCSPYKNQSQSSKLSLELYPWLNYFNFSSFISLTSALTARPPPPTAYNSRYLIFPQNPYERAKFFAKIKRLVFTINSDVVQIVSIEGAHYGKPLELHKFSKRSNKSFSGDRRPSTINHSSVNKPKYIFGNRSTPTDTEIKKKKFLKDFQLEPEIKKSNPIKNFPNTAPSLSSSSQIPNSQIPNSAAHSKIVNSHNVPPSPIKPIPRVPRKVKILDKGNKELEKEQMTKETNQPHSQAQFNTESKIQSNNFLSRVNTISDSNNHHPDNDNSTISSFDNTKKVSLHNSTLKSNDSTNVTNTGSNVVYQGVYGNVIVLPQNEKKTLGSISETDTQVHPTNQIISFPLSTPFPKSAECIPFPDRKTNSNNKIILSNPSDDDTSLQKSKNSNKSRFFLPPGIDLSNILYK